MADKHKRTKRRARKFLRLLQQQLSQLLPTPTSDNHWIEARFQTAIDTLPESEAKLKAILLSKRSRYVRLLCKQVFSAKKTHTSPQIENSPKSTSSSKRSRHARLLHMQVFSAKETQSSPQTKKSPKSSSSSRIKRSRRSPGLGAMSKLVDDHQCSVNALQNHLESISSCECLAVCAAESTSDTAERVISNLKQALSVVAVRFRLRTQTQDFPYSDLGPSKRKKTGVLEDTLATFFRFSIWSCAQLCVHPSNKVSAHAETTLVQITHAALALLHHSPLHISRLVQRLYDENVVHLQAETNCDGRKITQVIIRQVFQHCMLYVVSAARKSSSFTSANVLIDLELLELVYAMRRTAAAIKFAGVPEWFQDLQKRSRALPCPAALLQWSLDTLRGSRTEATHDLNALHTALAPPCVPRTMVRRLLQMVDTLDSAVHRLLCLYRASAGELVPDAVGGDGTSKPIFFVDTRGNEVVKDQMKMRSKIPTNDSAVPGTDVATGAEQTERE